MKPRDLAIVGAVVLIAGFAAIDAVRPHEENGERAARTRPARTEPGNESDGPVAPRDELLRGRLVYTDAACNVTVADLATLELSGTGLTGSCGLWGPPGTSRIAYGVAQVGADSVEFEIRDLDRAQRIFGAGTALAASILWSPDGSRVAWCETPRIGWELVVGRGSPRGIRCPDAYTAEGRPAFIRGREVVGAGRTIMAPGPVSSVSFGEDGSLALAVGDELLRYGSVEDPNPIVRVSAPVRGGSGPVFTRDNCAAFYRSPQTGQPPIVTVVSLACARFVAALRVLGNAAAWSPDGQWIAVSKERSISFYSVDGSTAPVSLPDTANQLLWQAE